MEEEIVAAFGNSMFGDLRTLRALPVIPVSAMTSIGILSAPTDRSGDTGIMGSACNVGAPAGTHILHRSGDDRRELL